MLSPSSARYDDLESYCSALQGQMKDVQSQSGDRARALQTALEQEKDRCTQLRTLNDEAFELMALQELRIVSRLAVTCAGGLWHEDFQTGLLCSPLLSIILSCLFTTLSLCLVSTGPIMGILRRRGCRAAAGQS